MAPYSNISLMKRQCCWWKCSGLMRTLRHRRAGISRSWQCDTDLFRGKTLGCSVSTRFLEYLYRALIPGSIVCVIGLISRNICFVLMLVDRAPADSRLPLFDGLSRLGQRGYRRKGGTTNCCWQMKRWLVHDQITACGTAVYRQYPFFSLNPYSHRCSPHFVRLDSLMMESFFYHFFSRSCRWRDKDDGWRGSPHCTAVSACRLLGLRHAGCRDKLDVQTTASSLFTMPPPLPACWCCSEKEDVGREREISVPERGKGGSGDDAIKSKEDSADA